MTVGAPQQSACPRQPDAAIMPTRNYRRKEPRVTRICGIGVDAIEISRIKAAHQKWGRKFLERIYTEDELNYCLGKTNPYPSLAARFAAKEAAFKAVSQMGLYVIKWRDIEVYRAISGKPSVEVTGIAGVELHLALTHTNQLAIATVVAEAVE